MKTLFRPSSLFLIGAIALFVLLNMPVVETIFDFGEVKMAIGHQRQVYQITTLHYSIFVCCIMCIFAAIYLLVQKYLGGRIVEWGGRVQFLLLFLGSWLTVSAPGLTGANMMPSVSENVETKEAFQKLAELGVYLIISSFLVFCLLIFYMFVALIRRRMLKSNP